MKGILRQKSSRLVWQYDDELMWVEAWGEDSIRVRVTREAQMPQRDWALLEQSVPARITVGEEEACVQCGRLKAVISRVGALRFEKEDGTVVLAEHWQDRQDAAKRCALLIPARELKGDGRGKWRATVRFQSHDGEKIFGMGQYQMPYFDLKGCELELAQRNSQVSIPFYQSSLGYGLLWHNPGIGTASFAVNQTRFTAECTDVIDYWVTIGDTPDQINSHYMQAIGHPSAFPTWALGLWQSKLRYRTQEQLLSVAREYHRRGIPLSVIVCDFFHWPLQGDWCFDPADWPDPQAMVDELHSMGIELMVSIWTTVDPRSDSYAEMKEKGYLVRSLSGVRTQNITLGANVFYDATNPGARKYLFDKVRKNYLRYGIKLFWLDVAEPEYGVYDFENYRYTLGSCLEVGNLYPRCYGQGFYEGLVQSGVDSPITLARSAWVGSARYGTVLWSGDIHSRFDVLRMQFAAGLNVSLTGMPWWTTDIGGFFGGDPESPAFRELLIRWFQYGTFCPVFRLHGWRLPTGEDTEKIDTGLFDFNTCGGNEIWSFGEEAYGILKKLVLLRERMKPYLRALFDQATDLGRPVMRPLFYDFPRDERCWTAQHEMMLGPDMLVAPVLYEGMRKREVWLPDGVEWLSLTDGTVFPGGQSLSVESPLDTIPVFLRRGSACAVLLQKE